MEFDLNINSSSLPYNVAVGNPGKAKVTMKSHCKYIHTLYIIIMWLEKVIVMILHIYIA